jgi:hypothetical protein
MIKSIAVVIAAAVCAGLLVTFMPGMGPEVAAGAAQSTAHSTPDSATVNAALVGVMPSAADVRTATDVPRAAEPNLHNGSVIPKIACEQSWPYYEQSCLHDSGAVAGSPRVVRVIVTDRLAAGHPPLARR